MPIYEYICQKCFFEDDLLQNLNAHLEHSCPKCNGTMVRKISSPAIQFKGSGFYITDYKSQSKSGDSNKSSPPKSSPKNKNLAS